MKNTMEYRKTNQVRCFLKGIRKAINEREELTKTTIIAMKQKETIDLRIKLIDETIDEFKSLLYVFEEKDRKLVEIYIDSVDYEMFLKIIESELGMQEKDYKSKFPTIALKLYDLLPEEKNVSNIVSDKMQLAMTKAVKAKC